MGGEFEHSPGRQQAPVFDERRNNSNEPETECSVRNRRSLERLAGDNRSVRDALLGADGSGNRDSLEVVGRISDAAQRARRHRAEAGSLDAHELACVAARSLHQKIVHSLRATASPSSGYELSATLHLLDTRRVQEDRQRGGGV